MQKGVRTLTNSMYSENILDHFQNPRSYGKMKNSDVEASEVNALCGDKINVQLKISSGKIEKVKFEGTGCAISQATMSMLSEHVTGMKIEDVLKISDGEALKLLGIKLTPARLNCALLGLKTVKLAASKHQSKGNSRS